MALNLKNQKLNLCLVLFIQEWNHWTKQRYSEAGGSYRVQVHHISTLPLLYPGCISAIRVQYIHLSIAVINLHSSYISKS